MLAFIGSIAAVRDLGEPETPLPSIEALRYMTRSPSGWVLLVTLIALTLEVLILIVRFLSFAAVNKYSTVFIIIVSGTHVLNLLHLIRTYYKTVYMPIFVVHNINFVHVYSIGFQDMCISFAIAVCFFGGAVPLGIHATAWAGWRSRGSDMENTRYGLYRIVPSVGAEAVSIIIICAHDDCNLYSFKMRDI